MSGMRSVKTGGSDGTRGSTRTSVRRWRVSPDGSVIGLLRREVTTTATEWALTQDHADRLVLVINELVSNVVQHAATSCRVTVRQLGSMVRVLVTDRSCAPPVLQPPGPEAEHGRGLQIVDSLCHRWGWTPHRTGKTVWATVERAPLAESP